MAKEQTSELVFSADVSQFTQAISQMNSDIKLINSQFDASSSALDDWSNESEGLEAKLKQLNGTLESQESILASMRSRQEEYANTLDKNKKKLAELKKQYDAIVSAEGESSDSAKKLAKQMAQVETAITKNERAYRNEEIAINKQQTTINKTKKSIKEYEGNLEELNKSLKDTKKNTDDASTSTGKFGSAMKGIGAGLAKGVVAIGAAAAGAAASFLALAESTREYRTEMAKLETISDNVGANFDETKKAYQDLVAVTNDEGAATEAINNLLTAGFKGNELDEVNQYIQGAAIQWKDTLKAEGLSDSIQEWIGSGGESLTGNIAEMLERLGYNLETVKAETAGFSEEQRRAYLMNIMQKEGLGEVSEAYKEQNKDLYEASLAQQNFNDKMAELGAIAEPISTLLKNNVAVVIESLIPLITQLSEAFTAFLSGDYSTGAELISSIFSNIGTKAGELFEILINKVSELLPVILPKIVELLSSLLQKIIEYAPVLLDGAIKLFYSLVDAIPPTIRSLLKELPKIIKNLLDFFVENGPHLIKTGFDLLSKLIVGLIDCIPDLLAAADEIIGDIIDTFKETDWLEVGMDIMKGLLDGMLKIDDAIRKTVKKIGNKIKDGFTNFFDINSPSKLMSDEVGKYIGLGVLDGIEGSMSQVKRGLESSLNGITDNVSFGNTGGVGRSVVLNYTVNSPRQLSRREIYIQAKKMQTLLGGVN